jgi:molybdate transport system substrate-binding protein
MVALSACAIATKAGAETAIIAVATNFAEAGEAIVQDFEVGGPHRVKLSFGSTGKLYAQIQSGAPFHAFLAADHERPAKLVAEGRAVDGTQFTYAIGLLTLWSADRKRVTGDAKALLMSPAVRSIAIANPALAPYGLAAQQAMEKLGIWGDVRTRVVMGENIGQAFALVATGNATVGFVATPLLRSMRGRSIGGSHWDVPPELHEPIRQDAVLLQPGINNEAAKGFLRHLAGPKARAIMIKLGYKAP